MAMARRLGRMARREPVVQLDENLLDAAIRAASEDDVDVARHGVAQLVTGRWWAAIVPETHVAMVRA